jgi:hypothetical protein
MTPRSALRFLRLHGWLGLMWSCEALQIHDWEIYYWLTRRAAGCIAWRTE